MAGPKRPEEYIPSNPYEQIENKLKENEWYNKLSESEKEMVIMGLNGGPMPARYVPKEP